jgi:uncharacterized membrane protein
VPVNGKTDTLGFITSGRLDIGQPEGEERVSVFLPSCHPYFGLVTVARRSALRTAPIQLDEGVSYEFSFGAATPPGITIGGEDSPDAPDIASTPDATSEAPADPRRTSD